MAVRGTQAKTEIGTKILETFEGSFIDADQKTIRIPWIEGGNPLEIKITMTAAKDIVGGGASPKPQEVDLTPTATIPEGSFEMTSEEKKEVIDIIHTLNL